MLFASGLVLFQKEVTKPQAVFTRSRDYANGLTDVRPNPSQNRKRSSQGRVIQVILRNGILYLSQNRKRSSQGRVVGTVNDIEIFAEVLGHKTASGHHKVERNLHEKLCCCNRDSCHKTASGHHKVEIRHFSGWFGL